MLRKKKKLSSLGFQRLLMAKVKSQMERLSPSEKQQVFFFVVKSYRSLPVSAKKQLWKEFFEEQEKWKRSSGVGEEAEMEFDWNRLTTEEWMEADREDLPADAHSYGFDISEKLPQVWDDDLERYITIDPDLPGSAAEKYTILREGGTPGARPDFDKPPTLYKEIPGPTWYEEGGGRDQAEEIASRTFLHPYTYEGTEGEPIPRLYSPTSSAVWLDFGPNDPRTPEWARMEYARNVDFEQYPVYSGYDRVSSEGPREGEVWKWGNAVWTGPEQGWMQEEEMAPEDYYRIATENHGYKYDSGSGGTPAPLGPFPFTHPREGRGVVYVPGAPVFDWEQEIEKYRRGIAHTSSDGFPYQSPFEEEVKSQADRWGRGIRVPDEFYENLKNKYEEEALKKTRVISDAVESGEITYEEGNELVSKIMSLLLTDDEIDMLKERAYEDERYAPAPVLFPPVSVVPRKYAPGEEPYFEKVDPYWKDYGKQVQQSRAHAARTHQPEEEMRLTDPIVVEYLVPDPTPGSEEGVIRRKYFKEDPLSPEDPAWEAKSFAKWITTGILSKKKGAEAVVRSVKSGDIISGPYEADFDLPQLRKKMKLQGA